MKIMTEPLSNDQGPAFPSHFLQIILFGPFTYEPNVILGPLKIVSLQLTPSVGMACALARLAVESGLYQTEVCEVSFISSNMQLLLRHQLPLGATSRNANGTGSFRGFQRQANTHLPTLAEGLILKKKKKKLQVLDRTKALYGPRTQAYGETNYLKEKLQSFG